ncbi:MAG: TIGR03546 family protein [Candidatus Marinimicrobia bacterium]|nr:TIGR03546 family protein [Candidatus Neomarinimicrobiota bacterium]
MFFIKFLKKIIKALGSNASPNQLAFGFAMGMILGLTPFWNIHNLIVIFLIAIINVNISTALLALTIFGLLAPIFDGLFHVFGLSILNTGPLQGLFTGMYENTFFVLTRFNNTLVLGSFVISLAAFVPVFFGFKIFAKYYQEKLHPKVEKWKITKILKSSKIFNLLNTGYKLKN